MAVTSTAMPFVLQDKVCFEHRNEMPEKYELSDELSAQLAELGLRSMSSARQDYCVRKICPGDKDNVLRFLRRFFFRDEPMNKAVELLDTPDGRCKQLEEYSAATLDDGVSFMATDENDDIVGVIINGVITRKDANESDKNDEGCPNKKFARILRVLMHLDQEARIWDKLPKSCNTVVEIRIASTHPDWRGKGLMKALCEETERIAKQIGAGALRMDATSAFSAAAAERLRYKKVYGVRYADMSDAPQPPPPHLEARVYVKEL